MFTAPPPPAYTLEAQAQYIAETDPAWRREVIELELDRLAPVPRDGASRQARESAEALRSLHPVTQYTNGVTGFDLEAEITMPRQLCEEPCTVKIGDYLEGKPTIFELQPMGIMFARRVGQLLADLRAGRLPRERHGDWLVRSASYGLRAVRNPDIELERDAEGAVTMASLEQLDRMSLSLVTELGLASYRLWQHSQARGHVEKKP